MSNHGVACVRGHYRDGILVGEGRAILSEKSDSPIPKQYPYARGQITLEGIFNDGYLEGPVRGLDERGRLVFIGMYSKGLPIGHCWQVREGQGWLYGKVCEQTGRFSGQSIAFIYPDLTTCLVGAFEEGRMVKARPSCISGATYGNFNEDASGENILEFETSPIISLQVC